MQVRYKARAALVLTAVLASCSLIAFGQTTAFTFQGRLTDSANPANGTFDVQFKLFTTAAVGTGIQRGSTITDSMVQVENGVFTVQLNFGACAICFDGSARFLEISIRPAGSVDPYTTLSPRQPVTSTPYAIRSAAAASAETADNAGELEGIRARGFIQNTTSQQTMTNFNIAGDGTVGGTLSAATVNATMRYDIGGQRVFSIVGTDNVIAGKGAGVPNPDGSGNAFFGTGAGASTQMGNDNAFFGRGAGLLNTVSGNSFFGSRAGDANTTGTENAFFGFNAGGANQTGDRNAFFGYQAGALNTAGQNSFFGYQAGALNTAHQNSFFGAFAGDSNTSGLENAFFGFNAGGANETGDSNAFFGYRAGATNTGDLNSFFGNRAGNSNTSGNNNSFFGASAGAINTGGDNNAFFGSGAGLLNLGNLNSFFGNRAGDNNASGARNAFFGADVGDSNTSGSDNTLIGANADVGSGGLTFATAIGAGAVVSNSSSVVLGRAADTVRIPGSLNISGLGAATATHLCINAGLVSNCSSSLRYKDELAPFTAGLELIKRLRPITFNWKQSGVRDLGLAAEEVAAVEPLLVTYNERGQVEGVKYDRINIALINAVSQQQEQITRQQELIRRQDEQTKRQRAEIDVLKKLVCKSNPRPDICRSSR